MSIVHDAARSVDDPIEYFAETRPTLAVKQGSLHSKVDVKSTTILDFQEQVGEGMLKKKAFQEKKLRWLKNTVSPILGCMHKIHRCTGCYI